VRDEGNRLAAVPVLAAMRAAGDNRSNTLRFEAIAMGRV